MNLYGNFVIESCSDSIVMLLPRKNLPSDCEHDNNRAKLEKIKLKQGKGEKFFLDNIFATNARMIFLLLYQLFFVNSRNVFLFLSGKIFF